MKKIAITTAIAMLLGGNAYASPILDTTEVNESYTTKTRSVVVTEKQTATIKKAVGNYATSLTCTIGVAKTATKSQKNKAATNAKKVCNIAKSFAPHAVMTAKTSVGKVGQISLAVTSKDVVVGFPYINSFTSIGQSRVLISGIADNWVMQIRYPEIGGADWKTNPDAGDLVIHHYAYLCDSEVKDIQKTYSQVSFNQVNNEWKSSCKKFQDYIADVPFRVFGSPDGKWLRIVTRVSNNFGATKIVEQLKMGM